MDLRSFRLEERGRGGREGERTYVVGERKTLQEESEMKETMGPSS